MLATRQRTGADLDPTLVLLDAETGLVTLGLTTQDAAAAARSEAEAARGEEILRVLEAAQRWLPREDVLELVEGRHVETITALARLLKQERLVRIGEGKKADPYRYGLPTFSIPDSEPPMGMAGMETETSLFANEINEEAVGRSERAGRSTAAERRQIPQSGRGTAIERDTELPGAQFTAKVESGRGGRIAQHQRACGLNDGTAIRGDASVNRAASQ